jgi:hypothetical protein
MNNRNVGSGFPLKQLFQNPLGAAGGSTSAISSSPFSSEYFAVADSEQGLIEVSFPSPTTRSSL